jgi:hypothetical protein
VRRGPRLLAASGAALAGILVGALVSLSVQSTGMSRPGDATPIAPVHDTPTTGSRTQQAEPIRTETFLAWTPGGLPVGFEQRAEALPGIRRVVVVAADNVWMTRSRSADGQIVDDPRHPYRIPIEATAVDPDDFEPFLPASEGAVTLALAQGEGVLGESSAELRRIVPGGSVEFPRRRIKIAAVLPDELVGASELLLSRDVGRRIGVTSDRYALIEPRPGLKKADRLAELLRRVLPPGTRLQVRAPGDTPYPRQGDAVLPPVAIKLRFGEFAARPLPGGTLDVDPAWERENIRIRHLPLVGKIQCHRLLFPQLVGAIDELRRRGLSDLILSEHGCYVPKFILNDPDAGISHHAWGIAFDVNLLGNSFGESPDQPPQLVRILTQWGFIWGGRFIVPDGNHFEYHRPPRTG